MASSGAKVCPERPPGRRGDGSTVPFSSRARPHRPTRPPIPRAGHARAEPLLDTVAPPRKSLSPGDWGTSVLVPVLAAVLLSGCHVVMASRVQRLPGDIDSLCGSGPRRRRRGGSPTNRGWCHAEGAGTVRDNGRPVQLANEDLHMEGGLALLRGKRAGVRRQRSAG